MVCTQILIAVPTLAAIFGIGMAIVTFRKSNKIKAAEIFMNLELNFREHIPILLDIEYEIDYSTKIVKAINAVEARNAQDDDDKIILQLDSMLRHFHTCVFIKKLKVDNNTLNQAYSHYLRFFISKDRAELVLYIRKYWPSVYNWAENL